MATQADTPAVGIAIAVPEPWGEVLQERRASYGDRLAWTIPTHVTLLPPTQVPTQRMHSVDEHLSSIATTESAFDIGIAGAATFRPATQTVFLQISAGKAECSRLEARIRSGPLKRRLPFPYHPHVTLASEVSDQMLDRAFADNADLAFTFRPEAFTRYALGEDGIWLPERDYRFGWPAS